MHRTSKLITICVALLALASCSGGVPTPTDAAKSNAALTSLYPGGNDAASNPSHSISFSGSVRQSQETATLINVTPVPARMARLLRPAQAPVLAALPPLPVDAFPGRLPSAVELRQRQGNDSYAAEPGTADSGTSKVLDAASASGTLSWAIYQFTNIGKYDILQTLRVVVSEPHFTANPPGYWVGISDYRRGAWLTLGRDQTLLYEHTVGSALPYRSPAGNLYVFVLITDEQSVNVDSVEFDLDVPVWVEAEVDGGPDAGYSPALVFGQTGNPIVAYATLTDGIPRLAVGDRSADLRDPASWVIAPINPAPEGGGVWTDVVLDPQTSYPVVSLNYIGLTGGTAAENSRGGFSPMVDDGGDPFFLNYQMGFTDGAVYSSIDKKPGGTDWGMAICAANSNTPAKLAYDMQYRVITFDPLNWSGSLNVTLTSNFGSNWNFPHLRYNPQSGNLAVCVAGGNVFEGTAPTSLDSIYTEASTTALGSLAYNAAASPLLSASFQKIGTPRELTFVGFNASLFGTASVADSIPNTGVQQVGTCSQVAAWDGGWGLAYSRTEVDGSVHVKYAYRAGAATDWTIEEVSATPSVPSNPNNLVFLDLAYDAAGVAGISWNQVDGDKTSLHFALRGA